MTDRKGNTRNRYSQTIRVFDIVKRLGLGWHTVDQLASIHGSSRRSVYRDIEFLKCRGYPVRSKSHSRRRLYTLQPESGD